MLNLFYLFLFSSIKKNNVFIKYKDNNACVNCIYYLDREKIDPTNYIFVASQCKKFGCKNLVTDDIEYDDALECRFNNNKCGRDGIYFEPKEKNSTNN